jgi:hypothetical protein
MLTVTADFFRHQGTVISPPASYLEGLYFSPQSLQTDYGTEPKKYARTDYFHIIFMYVIASESLKKSRNKQLSD